MPDQTAHDAVRDALDRDVPYLGSGGREQRVENVLAALGIPPDTTTDTIHAGLWLLAHADGVHVSRRPSRAWVARDRDRYWVRGVGASPAAAVNALAARMESPDA